MMNKALEILRDLQECEGQPAELYEQIDEAIEELLAKPETKQEPDYYLWHDEFHEQHPTNEGDPDVYPLYIAPPKRELLGDGITADMYRANKKATHPDSYWAGVYDAEKAHGIT